MTLLFVDTNNGTDSSGKYDSNTSLGSSARSPAYKKGSLQYNWLEANLKDARDVRKSRFIFVVNHHCPYSRGNHNNLNNGQTAVGVRNELTPLLMKYGVTGWLCGHDEMQEHAQVKGTEELADGTTRDHILNVYDLGSAGDGLKGEHDYEDNGKYIVYSAYDDSPDGTHYGHLQVEVAPSNGTWYCSMTPMYSYFAGKNTPSELRHYPDRIVIAEGGEIAHEERHGDADESEVTVEYTRTKSVTLDKKSFLWNVTVSDERYVSATVSADDNGTATVRLTGLEETEQELSVCVYAGSSAAGKGTLVKRFVIHGVQPKPLVDEDETASIQQGSTYVFTTILQSDKWNCQVSDSKYVSASGVKNADNTYTVTITCPYSCESALTVKIFYGSTTSGSGTLLKTVTVKAVAAEKDVRIRVGESEDFSSSYSSSRYWAAGGEGANGGFLKVSATMNPTASAYTTYTGYSIRTSKQNASATLTLTGESVGTETVRFARQYEDSSKKEAPKDALILHVTVDPYPITVKPVLTTRKTTDAQDPTIQYEIVPATLPSGKKIELVGALARTSGSAAGAYDVTQGTLTDENNPNFTITFDEAAGKNAFEIHDVPVVLVAPTASITYGQMLSDGKISGSMKNSAGISVPGTFTFVSGTSRPGVVQSGKFAAVFTPTDSHFYEKVEVEVEVTIHRVQLSVKANDASATYGDALPSFDFSLTGLVNGDTKNVVKGTCNYVCDYKAGSAIGPYDIGVDLTNLSADNYTLVADAAKGVLTVSRKSVTVTADNKSKEFGEEDPPLTATVDGTIGTDTVTYSLSRAKGDDLGTYTITASGAEEQGNYTVTFKTGVFKITKAIPHAQDALTATITYGQKLSEAMVVGKMVNRGGEEVTGTFAFATPDKMPAVAESGKYFATFTANDTESYEKVEVEVEVEVEKATLTVKADDAEIAYGDKQPAFTCACSGFVKDDTESVVRGTCGYDCDYKPGDDIGEYEIDVIVEKLEADNYKFAADDEKGVLTVNRKQVTVKADDKSKVYGTVDPDFTATVAGTNGTDGVEIKYDLDREAGADVGTYKIIASGAEEQGNYQVSFVTGTFTISPRPITVTPTAGQSSVYGETSSIAYTCDSALVGTDAFTGVLGLDGKGAGAHKVVRGDLTIDDGNDGKNYAFTFVEDVAFTVGKKMLKVKADDVEIVYGDARPSFSCSYVEFVEGDDASVVRGACGYICDYEAGDDIGTYEIGVDVAKLEADNYRFVADEEKGVLTVEPELGVRFIGDRQIVDGGSNVVLRITGGMSERESTVQLSAVYATATAADLDLKNVTVNGELVKSFKFPYTLTWEADETSEQIVVIPVKANTAKETDEFLTFCLQNPMNTRVVGSDEEGADGGIFRVMIRGSVVSEGKVNVLAVPSDATRGKVTGSALVQVGKKVTVKATANKGYVFTGWAAREGTGSTVSGAAREGTGSTALDRIVSRAASYSFTAPANDVELVANFATQSGDVLELDDFLPAEIAVNELYSNDVSRAVTSLSVPTISVTGLPTGLKFYSKETKVKIGGVTYVVPANTIFGTPARVTTASQVKVTVSNASGRKIVRTYAVSVVSGTASSRPATCVKADAEYYAVTLSRDNDLAGTVTGAGVYQKGKKVTLKATANKGYVFMGWAAREGTGSTVLDELVSRAASYAFTMPANDVAYEARFVTAEEDAASIRASVDGTPLSDTAFATNVMRGVALQWPVVAEALSQPTVTVGNLPTGLRFTAKPVTSKVREGTKTVTVTNVPANTIYGVPTAVQTKTAKITVTTAGKSKRVYELKITVDPLPAYAQGTFDGPVFAEVEDGIATNGVATLTVAANGKVSGTIQHIVEGKNVKHVLSATSLADYDLKTGVFTLRPTYKDGSVTKTLVLGLAANVEDDRLGVVIGGSEDLSLELYQNAWKNAETKDDRTVAPYVGGTAVEWMIGDLKLTVKKNCKTGVVTIGGKVDGTSVSGSAQAYWVPEDKVHRAVVYLAPKGSFAGWVEVVPVIFGLW